MYKHNTIVRIVLPRFLLYGKYFINSVMYFTNCMNKILLKVKLIFNISCWPASLTPSSLPQLGLRPHCPLLGSMLGFAPNHFEKKS